MYPRDKVETAPLFFSLDQKVEKEAEGGHFDGATSLPVGLPLCINQMGRKPLRSLCLCGSNILTLIADLGDNFIRKGGIR